MRYCNGCGEQIRSENIFCPNCGFKQIKTVAKFDDSSIVKETEIIKEDPSPKAEQDYFNKSEIETNVQKESSKTLRIILVGILIFIGAIYFSNSKSNNNTNLISSLDSVAVDSVSGTQEIDNSEVVVSNPEDEAFIMKKHRLYLASRLDGRNVGMKVIFGDLNGDGVNDAFIDWCIEATDDDRYAGGGNALMFLECIEEGFSVYLKTGNEYVLKADKSKDIFTDEGFSYKVDKLESGRIICSNTSYADDDPRCCPSIKRTIYLVFRNNEILKPNQAAQISSNEN